MKSKLWLAAVILVFAVAGYDIFNVTRSPDNLPPLNFTSIKGHQFSLESLRGKPVLVTFWATTCASCIKEIPHLIELYNNYHPKGLEIIAIAMRYDPPNYVIAMSKEKALPYEVVYDVNSSYAQAFGGVNLTPNSFLIAPNGEIVLHKLGLLNQQKIESLLAEFLKGVK
jgi:thiol-disulfide isomerase/thioredoxin